jgi:hypothetical protein
MIRPSIVRVDELPADDRSMRFVEYAIALVAIAAAAFLALIR